MLARDYSLRVVTAPSRWRYTQPMGQNTAIVRARMARGFTQEQAAEKLGVSQPTYQRWEAGTRTPRAANLVKIAELYGVPMDSLLGEGSGDQDAPIVIPSKAIARDILTGALKGLRRSQPIDHQVNALLGAILVGIRLVREDPTLGNNHQALQAVAGVQVQARIERD